METEMLVTQFTCDRGGVICSRPPDQRRNVYIEESMWRMIRRRLFDSEVVHKAEPTFFRGIY